jgi:hypothetical protein
MSPLSVCSRATHPEASGEELKLTLLIVYDKQTKRYTHSPVLSPYTAHLLTTKNSFLSPSVWW